MRDEAAHGISEDPRCRRTRTLLQEGLGELMRSKNFERISVADIAEAAAVNRATFYDHYADKFALLDELVSARFDELLARRGVAFDGSCECALSATVLAVCDYLASEAWMDAPERPQAQSHLEASIVAVVRRTLLAGMRSDSRDSRTSASMIATASSWAIYGAAKEWLGRPNRPSSTTVVSRIVELVSPMLAQAQWIHDDAAVTAAH